jgi:phosphatidylinositol alpha-1,6-mannosyltransferase
VLVGDSGGAPETVLDGETGYVVDARDPAVIAARAAELLGDPGLVRVLGDKARAWVQEEWSWDQSVATLRRLLA